MPRIYNPAIPRKYRLRLLRLADFLDRLPKEKFKFSTIVGQDVHEHLPNGCGTNACAIGWCPTVFPKLLRFDLQNTRKGHDLTYNVFFRTREGTKMDFHAVCLGLFGLGTADARALFVPRSWDQEDAPTHRLCAGVSIPILGCSAAPKQVARNLRLVCYVPGFFEQARKEQRKAERAAKKFVKG